MANASRWFLSDHVGSVVGQGRSGGSHQGLGLAEGRRGLCRAQPVTLPPPPPSPAMRRFI